MAEYIEREALLEKQYNANDITNLCFENMVVDVRDIEEAPTADVVEVVRCKDCKHFTPAHQLDPVKYPNQICADGLCENVDKYADYDGFCSDGERGEDE